MERLKENSASGRQATLMARKIEWAWERENLETSDYCHIHELPWVTNSRNSNQGPLAWLAMIDDNCRLVEWGMIFYQRRGTTQLSSARRRLETTISRLSLRVLHCFSQN